MINYSFSLLTFEYFLLILVRISCFVSVAPFFGMQNTPGRVKIGVSVFISLLLYQIVPRESLGYTGIVGYSIIVVKEGITGLLIGFAANICNSIILLAGNLLDMNIGFSMATEYNPQMQTQASVSANFYNYLVLLLLIVTNMHHYILRAVADSYQLIPVNGQVFQWDALIQGMVTYMINAFVLAFRIILPVFACIMILNSILGVMAKVSPQMNMFAVGMQLKVLAGLIVMFLTIGLFLNVSDFIFDEMKRTIVSMIKGMYES
ncbi:MAG: flagellar biosynthetic protein FliR [Lachnospiraceae bacterium]|nr:flagellar biosynthetic protein FliR [Lachnospiraceae bacterium]